MTFDPSMYGLSTDPAASGFGGYYDVNGTRYYFEGQQQVPGGAGMTPAQQAALATISDPYASDASKQAAAATYQQALLSPSGGGLTAPLPGIGLPGPGGTGGTGALPGGGGGGAGGGGTAQQRDAYSLIKSELSNYGLTSPGLADWVWQEIVDGKSSNEVLLDLRQRPEFKAAFPEIDARRAAGLAPLSPGDIISYRQQARQLMRAAGLPPGFYDSPTDFAGLLGKDVSLSELSQRISDAAQAAYSAPVEDRAQFAALGFGHGDLTAMFLNPDVAEPLLHKQWTAAQLSGSGVRSGFGALTAPEALNLTDLGVTQGQADQGFGLLQHEQQLFNPLDAGETAISRQDQIAAGLGGNAMAQQRIQDRARRRVATFAGGGNFSGSSSGLSGFGSSGG